jgi:nitrite reductase/ring-hydroxylating ferredoxin subunit
MASAAQSGEAGGWYPVALSGGVPTGTSNGTHLLGEEIVVWRDGEGAPHVWEDRCPHRGMRLSFGFVRRDRIACLYHGWQYGADGRCLAIPAHPDLKVPPTITVWKHTCHEALGMIWAHLREATGTPSLPDDIDSSAFLPVRSIHVDCAAETLAEAFASSEPLAFNYGGPDPDAPRNVRRLGPLVILTIPNGPFGDTLAAGVQPLGASRSALHLLVAVDEEQQEYVDDARLHYARFAEQLRDRLERDNFASGQSRATGSHAR